MTTTARNATFRSRSSPTPRPAPACSPTRPRATTTTSRPRSASSPTTRTSPSRCSQTRGTTSRRAGSTASPTAWAATRSTWTALKAWGSDRPEPERFPGSGGAGYPWPAHGWHEFRDPNEEWELTLYRYNANVVRQINQNIDTARETKAFEQWNPNWVTFVERHVGAWMHVEQGLGLYLFANANRRAPTNMHNNAIAVNSMHKIRFAQDLALYNLTLSEEVEGFDGKAHNDDLEQGPGLAGRTPRCRGAHRHRRLGRGDLRRQHGLRAAGGRAVPQQAGAAGIPAQRRLRDPHRRRAGSTTTPRATCATPRRCSSRWSRTRSSPTTTRNSMNQWLSTWDPRCLGSRPPAAADLVAARLQAAALRGRPGPCQEPLQRHSVELGLKEPEGADPVTYQFKTTREPVQVRQHGVQQVRRHPDEQPGRRGGGEVMAGASPG